jgi:hypothetical protein
MEHLTSSITSSARASKNGGMAIPRVFCAVKEKFGDTVQYGRCYRTRGPRYVERRYYGDAEPTSNPVTATPNLATAMAGVITAADPALASALVQAVIETSQNDFASGGLAKIPAAAVAPRRWAIFLDGHGF